MNAKTNFSYTPNASDMPYLKLEKIGGEVILLGWDHLDRWATMNIPSWNRISKESRYNGYSETMKLKRLAELLTRQNLELVESRMKAIQVPSVIIQND